MSEGTAGDASEFDTVRTVRTVKVPTDAEPLPSGPGANEISFSWDETSRRILQATSGRGPITPDVSSELLTALSEGGGALEATVVLRNVGDELIRVDGVLVHEIRGDEASLTLRSRPIDVVLRPRGEIRATFTYLLPSGDYQAGAAFVSD